MLEVLNSLYSNRIEVKPVDRREYLYPFARLCYEPHSPFNIKGPKFFAQMLYLAVNFRKSEDSDAMLDMEEIDYELQKLKKEINGE